MYVRVKCVINALWIMGKDVTVGLCHGRVPAAI